MAQERITEIIPVKIDAKCYDNPIYLVWVCSNGGRGHWLFQKRQQKGVRTSVVEEFKPFVEDIETARSNAEYLAKESTPFINLGANNVDTEDMLGIQSLLEAPKVEMLMNPTTWETEGVKWQTVRLEAGSYNTIETSNNKHNIEFTINLVDKYLQSQ